MMTSPYRYPEFRYIKNREFWKSCQFAAVSRSVRSLRSESSVGLTGLFCLFIDPYWFSLSVSLRLSLSVSLATVCCLNIEQLMIVNCWGRVPFVLELPTPGQLCSNGSPRPSEEVPGGLYHSFSVDLSETGLINGLSGKAFGTGPSDSVIIGAGPNHGVTFGTFIRIRPWKSMTQQNAGFNPKTHCETKNRIRLWKPTAKQWYYFWCRENILIIFCGQLAKCSITPVLTWR